MKQVVNYIIGVITSLALIIMVLLTSVQIAVWGSMSFYEIEYIKNGVTDRVNMEMNDLLHVTEEMLDYLKGEREELQVDTIIDGKPAKFYNEREIAHMEDVQRLFTYGFRIRDISVAVFIAGILYLIITKSKPLYIMSRCFTVTSGIFAAVAALAGIIVASDFNKYFTIFHEIFFDNDLWILNPETDLLINIVPEQFFSDMTQRIGITFGVAMVALLAVSISVMIVLKKQRNYRE